MPNQYYTAKQLNERYAIHWGDPEDDQAFFTWDGLKHDLKQNGAIALSFLLMVLLTILVLLWNYCGGICPR